MALKRTLFHTTFLTAIMASLSGAHADPANLVIDGSPSSDEISSPEGPYGVVWVGQDNSGNSLTVTSTGAIASDSAALGINAGSENNSVTLSGTWNNTGDFAIGYGGANNVLTINGTGQLTTGSAKMGFNASSDNNTATLSGTWNNTGIITLGYEGANNTLTINGTGNLTTDSLWLGGFYGANGNQAIVDGADATLATTGGLTIGYGDSINPPPHFPAGYGSNNNSVTAKNGAAIATIGNLDVGFNGDGNSLNVESGATVLSGDDMRIAAKAGSDGNTVTVSGAGSTLIVIDGKTLYVGRSGDNNALTVKDQGALNTGAARIGGGSDSEQATSGNSVTVTGTGSRWELTGTLRVGDGSVHASSNNTLNIEDGGTVELMDTSRSTFIGKVAADTGNAIKVSGTGSKFTAGDISVGLEATNSLLEANNGGVISAAAIGVGRSSALRVGSASSLSASTLQLTNGSKLGVYVDNTTPSTITVSGTAALDGTLEASVGTISARRYDVVNAGNVTGTFDAFTLSGASDNYTTTLGYDPTAAYLVFTAALGNGTSLNDNQSNVAGALNDYFNAGGTLEAPIASLYDLTGSDLQTALTQASGEVGASGGVNAVERATTSFLNLLMGGGGQSAAGSGARNSATAALETGIVPTADVPPAQGGWSMWGGVYGGAATLPGSSSKGSHDTDTNVGGIAAGWDYDVAAETRIGLAIAGGQTNWDLDSGLGNGQSTFVQLGGYGTQHFGASYLSLAGAYAWHSMDTSRTVNVDDKERLDADFSANNLSGRVEAGHRFSVAEQLGLTPYAAFQAQGVYMPGYTEDGGSFALSYKSETATALRSELGLGFDVALAGDASAARLFGRAAWAHDWTSDPTVQASFASLDMSTFTVTGAEIPADIALVTAGAGVGLSQATDLAATFDGEFGSGYQSYAGSLKLTYNW